MHNKLSLAGFALALAVTAGSPTSFAADAAAPKKVTAQDLANTKPSATFEFEGSQIRLLVGGASGKGTLHFQGKAYPFTAKGASVGGVGANEVQAKGVVHYLEKIEDFPGQYNGLTMGATVGAGKGASSFQNGKGVVLSVTSRSEGLALTLGVSSFAVTLVK